MTFRLKNDCNYGSNPLGISIFLKFPQIVGKKKKQDVIKLGNHSLSGFRVEANTLVWDKTPP